MSERDSKRIIRRWNREIEAELRREAEAQAGAKGPWRTVVWAALWLIWLALILAVLARVASLR